LRRTLRNTGIFVKIIRLITRRAIYIGRSSALKASIIAFKALFNWKFKRIIIWRTLRNTGIFVKIIRLITRLAICIGRSSALKASIIAFKALFNRKFKRIIF
jgi:hypothetical protein